MLNMTPNDSSQSSTFIFYQPTISIKLHVGEKASSKKSVEARLKSCTADCDNVKLVDHFSFSNFDILPEIFTDNIETIIQFIQEMVEKGEAAKAADDACDSERNKIVIYNIQVSNEYDGIAFVSIAGIIKNLEDSNDISDTKSKPFHIFATSDGRIVNDATCLAASGFYEPSEDPEPIEYGKYPLLSPCTVVNNEARSIESFGSPSL